MSKIVKFLCSILSSSRISAVDSEKNREIIYKYKRRSTELVTNLEKVGQTINWTPI